MLKCPKFGQDIEKPMKIGELNLENNLLLAPMAGVTDLPYRLIMKSFGASLVFTEMISANGLFYGGGRTRELLRSRTAERPLAVQLFGADPQILAHAATQVAQDGEIIDLNLGCPVKKVVSTGAGSALLREPRKVAAVLSAVRRVSDLPMTVKIRSGWDSASVNFLEIGRIAQEEGVEAIILHPRTRAQGFSGKADWSHIRRLKQSLTIPVIGSGDIFYAQDALDMVAETGCDGVMIGRGSYGNPWLLANILRLQSGETAREPSPAERHTVIRDHLELHLECFGHRRTLGEMRKHLSWYSKGLPGSSGFRAAVNSTFDLNELRNVVDDFFSAAEATA